MTSLREAAVIERDLRMTKYPAQIRADRIAAEDAEADAKAWAAIAFRLGAVCEPQGNHWHVRRGGADVHRPHWFGGEVFWAHWFETGRALWDFTTVELIETATRALARREADLAAKPGDLVKLARRDAGAQILAWLEGECEAQAA